MSDCIATMLGHIHAKDDLQLALSITSFKDEELTPTLLNAAAFIGSDTAVNMLLDKGIDPNGEDENKTTAIMTACVSGHEMTVSLLLEQGADIHHKNSDGVTAFEWIFQSEHIKYTRTIRTIPILIKAGVDVNKRLNGGGQTALMRAVSVGNVHVLDMLYKHGADPDVLCFNDCTPLLNALRLRRSEEMKYLLTKTNASIHAGVSTQSERSALEALKRKLTM